MPLPEETLKGIRENLRKAEAELKAIEPEIEKAKMAGIDVTEWKKTATELRMAIDKMRLVYGK